MGAGKELLHVIVGIFHEVEEVMLASFLAFFLSWVFNYRAGQSSVPPACLSQPGFDLLTQQKPQLRSIALPWDCILV